MREPAHRARLAIEARHELGRASVGRMKKLDRNRTVELQTLAAVHDAHAAFAKHRFDPIAPVQHQTNARIYLRWYIHETSPRYQVSPRGRSFGRSSCCPGSSKIGACLRDPRGSAQRRRWEPT